MTSSQDAAVQHLDLCAAQVASAVICRGAAVKPREKKTNKVGTEINEENGELRFVAICH